MTRCSCKSSNAASEEKLARGKERYLGPSEETGLLPIFPPSYVEQGGRIC